MSSHLSSRPRGGSPDARASGAPVAAVAAVAAAVVVATVLALVLAPLGLPALGVVAALVALPFVLRLVHDDVAPVVERVRHVTRAVARATGTGSGDGGGRARRGTGVVTALVVVGCAGLAWAAATQGTKAVLAVVAVVVVGVLGVVAWPLVLAVAGFGPSEPLAPQAPSADASTRGADPRRPGALAVLLVAAAGGGLAWVLATLGTKGLAAAAGALAVTAALVVARDRTLLVTFATTCSLTFVLHKSFGPQDLEMSGGAISVYVTTFDVLLLLLYGLWALEGTLVADLRGAAREPVVWFPLVGLALFLPSLLVAPSPGHAASELVRMGWMFLLYVYLAVRVRTRSQLWACLAGLAVFVAAELVVVVLQWRTGGVLGLSFLGVPQTLGERTTDVTAIGRPFGTIIHPVFMAAALGTVAVVALALAVHRKASPVRLTAALAYAACLACMWISQTRASFVAVAVVSLAVVAHGIRVGAVTWRAVRLGAVALAVAGVAGYPAISRKLADNFGTGHFWTEVESRLEMNEVAFRMIGDHPVLGVGLNNFEVVLPRYEQAPVIFFGHPVHNLYLLVLAETGLVGLVGLVVVGAGSLHAALRLARSHDPLLRPLGIGVAGAMVFLMVEELLGFSLRQDIPLALYWLLAGLVAAGIRMSGEPWPALRGRGSRVGTADERRTTDPTDPTDPSERGASRAGTAAGVARVASVPRRPLPGWARLGAPGRWARRTLVAPPAALLRRRVLRSRGVVLTGVGVLALVAAVPTASRADIDASAPASVAGAALGATAGAAPVAVPAQRAGLVFSAFDRRAGAQGIFRADLDGSDVRRITPLDGRSYNWPRWAFGNTKIVYTVRTGPPGSPESIAIMDPDGSGARVLQDFEYRVGQPIVEPNGRYVLFSGMAPWFPQVATFRLDLVTGESRNVSGVGVPLGGFDSDPFLRTGSTVTFIWTEGRNRASVAQMQVDGTDRRRITRDRYFNTDPGVSGDGRLVAIASYRGSGTPAKAGAGIDLTNVKPGGWNVVVRPTSGGAEQVLTQGEDCTKRSLFDACEPREMSGFVPRFTPDGRSVSFVGALDDLRTCLCTVSLDGATQGPVIATGDLAIDWYDWPQAPGAATDTSRIGTGQRSSRLLLVTARPDGTRYLEAATPDLMHRVEVPLPANLQPLEARWSPDRSQVVFTAQVPVGSPRRPHPAPPPGRQRRVHVTLDTLDPVATNQARERASLIPADEAQRQVFLRRADGSVRQLTDAWTEDWRDGLAPGDRRSSSQPVVTPDGRAVVVRNTSTLTGESFLLRIDLRTGAVENLTNGSAGAVPTDDAEPALTADGRRLAFTWTEGDLRTVHSMDARTGSGVAPLVSGDVPGGMAAWGPDGRSLVWVAGGDGRGGTVVRAAVPTTRAGVPGTTGGMRVLSNRGRAWAPVVAPEGDRVVYLAAEGSTIGLYASEPMGIASAWQRLTGDRLAAAWTRPAAPRVLQPDRLHNVFFADWR